MKLTPPTPEEYAPYYGAYVGPATARGDVLAALPKQIDELNAALGKLTDEQARFKFGPAEWSIKEVVGHMNDVERIFSYRLLCISRNDKTPLPGFEQTIMCVKPASTNIRSVSCLQSLNTCAAQTFSPSKT
ncbi:MAG: DinB family protein [Anaerolineales bacterium]|nr:DinB family protein [Anaerolineales bacterium]